MLQTYNRAAPLLLLRLRKAGLSCSYWEQTSNTSALEQLGHERAFFLFQHLASFMLSEGLLRGTSSDKEVHVTKVLDWDHLWWFCVIWLLFCRKLQTELFCWWFSVSHMQPQQIHRGHLSDQILCKIWTIRPVSTAPRMVLVLLEQETFFIITANDSHYEMITSSFKQEEGPVSVDETLQQQSFFHHSKH